MADSDTSGATQKQPWWRILDLIVVGLVLYVVGVHLDIFAARLTYPYDLEWMEGGMLAHAWRLDQGLPIYSHPTPDWIPFVYPPGQPTVVAMLGKIFGLSMPLGRSVSLFGTLLTLVSTMVLVGRHTRDWTMALAAMGAYLACYEASGAFYDLIRPDGLYLGFLTASVAFAAEKGKGATIASGLLLFMAFTFKQAAGAFGLPIAFAIWARDGWQRGMLFGVVAAAPALALTAGMEWVTEGMFLKYLLDVPGSHPFYGDRLFPGTIRELGRTLPVAALVGGAWVAWRGRRIVPEMPEGPHVALPLVGAIALVAVGIALPAVKGLEPTPDHLQAMTLAALGLAGISGLLVAGGSLWQLRWSWSWVLGMGVGFMGVFTAAMMRGHHGGFLNVLMPAFWVICVAMGIALGRIRQSRPGWLTTIVVVTLASAQLGWQINDFDLERLKPTVEDVEAGDRVVAELKKFEDPILNPVAPWMSVYAGRKPGLHLIALWDINHKKGPFKKHVQYITGAAKDHYWNVALEGPKKIGHGINPHYIDYRTVAPKGKVLRPKTGWRSRPQKLLIPKPRKKK